MKKQLLSILALFAINFATAQSVPNGGFENWTTLTCQNPQHYFSSSLQSNNGGLSPVNVIKTTDSYADSFAVKLTTTSFGGQTYPAYCANGNPGNSAGQGMPFSQQPTSLRLYYKCNVMTGDTALVFIMFKKAGVTISQNIHKITGTKASYTLLSIPLNLGIAPDSLIFGLTASNILTSGGSFHGIAGSMLQVDSVSFTGIATQPANLNGDFENWQTFSTAPTLNNWSISGSNTLNQTVDAFAGNFALELKTSATNNAHDTAYTSSATTGMFSNNVTVGGYPYTTQVDAFKFHYKYTPADVNDSAMVLLQFKKAGVTFTGGAITVLLPAAASYTAISIATSLSQVPDSVMVFFSSSKKFNYLPMSYLGADLKVDNAYFNSQATPVTNFSVAAHGCLGQAIQLTDLSANIPTTWTWTATGGNLSSSSAQNPTVTFTASGTQTITLNVGNVSGTGSVFSNTISITPLPTVAPNSPDGPICMNSGNMPLLFANNSPSTTATWQPGNLTGNSVNVGPNITTTYSVTATDGNGCTSNTGTITVTVMPQPTLTVTSPTICAGGTGTLTVSGNAATYTWNPSGATTTTYTVFSPPNGYTMTVIGTGTNSCTNSATATVTVNATPGMMINGTSLICTGQSTVLSGSGASIVSYTWTGGPTTQSYTVSPTSNATYTLTGSDANNCSNTQTVTVTVNSIPGMMINGNTTICNGQSTVLSGSGASITSYTWTGGPTTQSYTVSPTTMAVYTLTGSDANNCSNTQTATVTVNATPTVTATSGTICVGNSASLMAGGASTYTWTGGPVSQTYTVSPTSLATYTVTGTSANNCTNTATATVTVNALPVVTITSVSPTLCVNGFDTLVAHGANTYSWSTGSTAGAITVLPASTITYTVTGTDFNGCSNTATISAINCGIGIQQYNGNSNTITVYPNPNKGTFVVTTTQQANKIVVSDILGNELLTVTPIDNTTTISLNAQASGIYFVKIISDNAQTVKRIVINN